MADVEMKADNKPAGEEDKKEEEKVEEPTDQYLSLIHISEPTRPY